MVKTELEKELLQTLKEVRAGLIDSKNYTEKSVFILGIDFQIKKAEL